MANFLLTNQISPQSSGWRCKVLLLEKSNIQTTVHGKRIQKLVFMDEEGQKVQGIIWNRDIDALATSLQEFKTYIVGGADVQQIKEAFLHLANGIETQWVLKRSTIIRLLDTNEGIPIPPIPTVPYATLISLIGSETDILAVVLQVGETKELDIKGRTTKLQVCTVTQQEMKPFELTLWGDFVEFQGTQLRKQYKTLPLLLGKRIKISSYSGISLATTPASTVTINPDIPQAKELRNWVDNNAKTLRSTMLNSVQEDPEVTFTVAQQQVTVPVLQIEADKQNCWTKVGAKFTSLPQEFYYMCCPKCFFKTEAKAGEEFLCHSCKHTHMAIPKCKINLTLYDTSGMIQAAAYDKTAEKIIGYPAIEIMTMPPEVRATETLKANDNLHGKEFIVEIKAARKRYNDGVTRYTIHKWVEQGLSHAATTITPTTSTLANNPDAILPMQLTESTTGKKDGQETSHHSISSGDDNSDTEMDSSPSTSSSANRIATLSPMKRVKLE